ncbi:MAG: hypothetical protein ABW199_01800 [Caulobacterales bacterium]
MTTEFTIRKAGCEGVSSDLESKTFQMMNCPSGQGFLFHRPLDAHAFELSVQ